jgi:hypothetical protein
VPISLKNNAADVFFPDKAIVLGFIHVRHFEDICSHYWCSGGLLLINVTFALKKDFEKRLFDKLYGQCIVEKSPLCLQWPAVVKS